ncbi:GntR family transcriptional regulator [Sulfobacillus thermosulfidooxidans]|uniref:GntR family transcriptional regulator n=1 Tax=Sulfobacillus thermosulfidooxidans TaxID=28034 RepID=UPI0006B4855F|nr:GntR family transcriptional regulator [Sulfobacillus thermosulfidooxidans]
MKAFSSHIPYYYQIKEDIIQHIAQGHWSAGDQLPSEPELAHQYQVSRATIRQALAELAQEGYLIREKGRGTFVSHPIIVDNAQVFTTFEDAALSQIVNQTHLVQMDVLVPPAKVAHELDLSPADRVYEITTVRGTQDEKLAVRTSLIPEKFAPDLMRQLTRSHYNADVYHILQEQYGLVLTGAEQIFQSIAATTKEAKLLGIRRGVPLMLWQGLIYATGPTKLARVRTIFRGDRFSFTIRQGKNIPVTSLSNTTIGTGILDMIDGRIW